MSKWNVVLGSENRGRKTFFDDKDNQCVTYHDFVCDEENRSFVGAADNPCLCGRCPAPSLEAQDENGMWHKIKRPTTIQSGESMTELNRRDFLKLVLASAPTTLVSSRVFESDLLQPAPDIKAISGRGMLHTGQIHEEGELILIGSSIFIALEDSHDGRVPVAMVSTGVNGG